MSVLPIAGFVSRKRLFQNDNDEVVKDISGGLEYIRNNKNITNVLLTGGDPLIMSNKRLEAIFQRLCEIEHVQIIRIGPKYLPLIPSDSGQ